MSKTPLIAVPAQPLRPGRVSGWGSWLAFAAPAGYVESLRRAGARPVLLTQPDDADPREILEPFDGLLLMGGGDVEPSRYGQEPHPYNYGVEPDRDDLEIALLRAADELAMPTLAICRGAQVLNVAFGGTLHQHLPDLPGVVRHGPPLGSEPVLHDVKIATGTRIAEAVRDERLSCSSHHHQGIDRLGEGLLATGWSDDGLIEALERENGWTLAVQWHPEETALDDPPHQGLFDALVARARPSA
ncbi:MAG: gamma-glutamyl-gamma-aminobutyrate hydrolase family protein [Actinomycetota bacterium]